MLQHLLPLDLRRRRLLARAPDGPLRDYLSVPFPAPKRDAREVAYLALDLETTGLDPARHEIVSVGVVEMIGGRIELAGAEHRLVRPEGPIPEASAVVHRITDDRAAEGEAPAEVVGWLLERLAGKVLVAHHCEMEWGFLDAACRRLFGGPFLAPVVDTQWLARRALERRNQPYRAGELRLAALRERYNLPRYRAHNALSDALACAELFAAQLAEREGGGRLPLKGLLAPR